MYKKYVHPCYSWNNECYKQIDDSNKFISSQGKIVELEKIEEYVKNDRERIDSGDITATASTYGILDSTEQEFVSKVFDNFEELHKNIVATKLQINKLKQITGVNFEI